MLESQEKKIGEIMYRVTQLPALPGRKLLVRLYKTLGPTIGAALKGLPDSGSSVSLGSLESSSIGDALTALAHDLTEDDLEYVVTTLTGTTEFSRETNKWLPLRNELDDHWAGKYLQMFQWIAFGLQVNYADFLAVKTSLSDIISDNTNVARTGSGSPNTSTGSCTELHPPNTTQ